MTVAAVTPGFVAALELERRWLGAASVELRVEVAGVGRARAEAASRRLLERGATALVSWGLAGGLDPALAPGSVVVPDEVVETDGTRWRPTDGGWRDAMISGIERTATCVAGTLICSSRVVGSVDEKRALRGRWGGVAVDMESAGVAAVAAGAGVPWIAVRAVADAADRALPAAVAGLCDDDGRLRRGAAAALVLRPRLWPALLAVGRGNAAAARSMRRVAESLCTDVATTGVGAR